MRITDAQAHIWKADSPERPWLPGVTAHRSPPLGMDELLREMDAAGVERCVLVPPTLDADRNDYCLEAAQKFPARFAVMGRLNLEAPGARERIAAWLEQKGMLGLRFSFQRPWVGAALKEGRLSVTMFTEEMTWIPSADMEWIMGRGLSEWIGWT